MYFLNRWEIDDKANRHRNHPVLGPATQYLVEFRDMVDENSDGWAHWSAAPTAAARLMKIAETPPIAADDVTLADVRKALTPIKSLCTKHKLKAPALRVFQPRLPGFENAPRSF
jgi:hypothetical protein